MTVKVINQRQLKPEDLTQGPLLGTHDGRFHCDEALALAMLTMLPEYQSATIVRSRNPDTHQKMDVLVDVGGLYDADAKRFDHHMKTFTQTFPKENPVTKLSSAGLVWLHFGKTLLTSVLGVGSENADVVWRLVYDDFIESIDAIDNGVDVGSPAVYKVSTDLSSRVARLYPQWNDKDQDDVKPFQEAMALCKEEFLAQIKPLVDAWLPARLILEKCLTDDRTIVLPYWIPYTEHLYAIEKERGLVGHYLYVVYPGSNDDFKVRCVSVSSTSFENRKSLPKAYWGLRDDQLPAGIEFVHANGFIGSTTTLEAALKLTKEALSE